MNCSESEPDRTARDEARRSPCEAAGLGLALGLTRVMRALLYEVEPTDPWSVAGVAGLVVAVAAVASWWPARRAMQVDPLSLLRDE